MKKNYLILTSLLMVSSMTSQAATTEADFAATKSAAIAKMTSWSEASPFAPDAFAQGILDLNGLEYGKFPSGDEAIEGIDALVASTLDAARAEFNVKLPTIFVTMTTDALTSNPVDGKSLFGTMDTMEMLDMDAMRFQTHDKACQASAWHLYSLPKNDGYYSMRNNMTYYLRMWDDDGQTRFSPYYYYGYQAPFKIDFADNGKMQLCLEDGRYMGTDAEGGMTVYDEFCDATSWTFTRAYGPQCDMPVISTKDDPQYYLFRNVYDPEKYLTSVYPDSPYMEMGTPSNNAMWYFSKQTVANNDWMRCTNKSGHVIYTNDGGHAYCGNSVPSGGLPYMTFMVIDGLEDLGLVVFINNQSRFQIVEFFSTPTSTLLCYDSTITPGVEVDLSYFKQGRDLKRFLWTIETGADANLMAFFEARDKAVASIASYKESQPWAHDAIERKITEIEACSLNSYDSLDAALADIDSKASGFLASLPTLMLEEASDPTVYFTLNNVRRKQSDSEAGWIVAVADGKLINTTSSVSEGSAWQVEPLSEGNFALKNHEGGYIGSMKSGSEVVLTDDASAAAKLSFRLADGYVLISASRSALNLDDNDGTLMAAPATDPGSQWTLGQKVIIEDDWLEYSTFANAISYEMSSLSKPGTYLEGAPSTWYLMSRDYFNEECYFYFEPYEDGNGCYIICTPYGKTRSRIWWWREDGNPAMYDDTANVRNDYDDRWYLIPVDHEDNSDEQRAYQISLNYPPKGNSCISVEKNPVGCLNMKPATDKENTIWIFKKLGELDHERIFNEQLRLKLPIIEGAIAAQPWARGVLDPAYKHLTTCTMQDFGSDCYSAINALSQYISDAIDEVVVLLEEEPDGCAVRIKNVRRASSGNPAYLASVDGHLNSLDFTDDNAPATTWTFEYYNNGRYRLINDNGEYLGALEGDDIITTTDRSQAGLYALVLNENTISLVVRNEPKKALNLNNAGGNACTYDAGDAGSQWVIELVRTNGVREVGTESAEGRSGLYDLRGFKVDSDKAAPGIYIERQGGKVIKRVIE